MEYKKVLVIKDIHNNTDQESQQAQSAKRKKLLNKTKIKLEPINKPTQWNLYSGDTLGTKASVPWIEVPPD